MHWFWTISSGFFWIALFFVLWIFSKHSLPSAFLQITTWAKIYFHFSSDSKSSFTGRRANISREDVCLASVTNQYGECVWIANGKGNDQFCMDRSMNNYCRMKYYIIWIYRAYSRIINGLRQSSTLHFAHNFFFFAQCYLTVCKRILNTVASWLKSIYLEQLYINQTKCDRFACKL